MDLTSEPNSKDVLDTLDALDDALLSPPLFVFPVEDGSTSSSSGSSSQHSGSPRNDWVLPGKMWSQDSNLPVLDDLGGFSMDWTGLDIDAGMTAFISDQPELSIDPNALFQFSLAPPDVVSQPLQLPTPSAGSASRSTSPAPNKPEHNSSAGVDPSDLDVFAQLGQRARDAANVTLAIPTEQPQLPISPVSPTQPPPSKVAIPRLRPSKFVSAPPPAKHTITSVTHVTLPVPTSSLSLPVAPQALEKTVRPKTSHTTIERRYRTNLNARILALRRAVPALRILEKNSATQTQGKGLTGASTKWDFDDVINERGYVDGVKAAKKNSKGVVLGKAVEYIRALKRREARLRRESDGLRALLAGLVGGPELLHEWEREWRVRFGGEEADEVDEDEADADIEVDCDDGAAEEESDDDDARAKKRARTATKTLSTPPVEKRKRGRPRKHPIPAPIPVVPLFPTVPSEASAVVPAPASTPASKPLLALALIFSFFRPSARPTGNTGSVLTAAPEVQASGWSALQVLHILISVILLMSLVKAYLPRSITQMLPDALLFTPPIRNEANASEKETLTMRDERALRSALGAKGGVSGVARAILTRILRLHSHDLRAWRRVGEFDVVRGPTAPLLSRIQTYMTLAAHAPRAPADSIILALLARAFAPSSAAAHWWDARRSENSTAVEKLVLDLDIDDAAKFLAVASSVESTCATSSSNSGSSDSEDDDSSYSPVHLIATQAVLARAKTLAGNIFIATVTGAYLDNSSDAAVVHAAGGELGGELAVLTRLLERVARWPVGDVEVFPSLEIDAGLDNEENMGEVRSLLHATILFRRTFPALLPPKQDQALHLALRRSLASTAFDASVEIEEARDRVVDMLAEVRHVR